MCASRNWLSLVVLGAAAVSGFSCGGEEKPSTHTASAVSTEATPVDRTASSASLGDSALEPAAKAAMKEGDWPRAESLYGELARRQPRNPAGKRGLGIALVKQEKNDKAVEALQGSLELGDDVETRLQLAAAFGALGRYPSALPHLRKAVKLAPANPATWSRLADALVKVEKPDSAAETLLQSKQPCAKCAGDEEWGHVADTVAEALGAKAEKLLAAKDVEGARKNAEAATALRPDLGVTHLVQARIAKSSGEARDAEGEYRKAMEGLPDAKSEPGAAARLELATLLMTDGKGGEAVKLAREVVAARGDDGAALDALGRACDVTKDVGCARGAYDKLANLQPGQGSVSKEAVEHARTRMKVLKSARPAKARKRKR